MERILIVRLSAMGDLIHGIPVLAALRAAKPDAFIGWVAEGRNGDLLEGHPALDRLIRVPRRWLKSPRAVGALRRELKELQFDTTIDLQCLTKSAVAARLSGAPRRIGYAGALGRELSRFFHNSLVPVDAEHVIDRYLAILQPLGITNPEVEFNLPERSEDAQYAETELASFSLKPKHFAIVNPGAGWASKIWPAKRYGQLARRLLDEQGIPSLAVWGPAEELALAEQIVAASGGAAQLAPPTTMLQLSSFSRRAKLFVGSDTGPLHLAIAVGTPAVSLHGTSLAAQTGAYGPLGRRVQVHNDTSKGRRRHNDDSAMRAITVEMVSTVCHELLASAQPDEVPGSEQNYATHFKPRDAARHCKDTG
jgi:heptosyltransferase-1